MSEHDEHGSRDEQGCPDRGQQQPDGAGHPAAPAPSSAAQPPAPQPPAPPYGQPAASPYGSPSGPVYQQAPGQSWNQPGYPQQGFATPSYPQPGYPPPGYEQPGYPPPGYPPSGYPQQSYGQPGYAQQSYGQPGYAQQSYGQPGYAQQSYPQPGTPEPPKKKGKGVTLSLLGLVAVLVAGAVVAVLMLTRQTYLDHSAVESYIATNFQASGVTCNGGSNIKVQKGKTFTCTAANNARFTVTMNDDKGSYTPVPDNG
jgi:hypothetical protein